jgi:phage repressor protein C with HTH and peptisase S24 domain
MQDMELHERLKWARERRGYETASAAAKALHIPYGTYSGHENSGRGIPRDRLREYARAFRVSAEWLLTGDGSPDRGNTIAVVGYVGAGAEIHPIDDFEKGGGLDEIELDFPVPPGTTAVIVRGESMMPVFEDGDCIGYYRDGSPPAELIGKTCVVKLMDGRTFIKKIRRGSTPGLFTLVSSNASDIEDVAIDWAGKLRFRIPRDEWRKL